MKKKYILTLAALGLISSALAQGNITGVIKNAAGEPVVGALVYKADAPREKSVTDENGLFAIEASEGMRIGVNYADFLLDEFVVEGEHMTITLDNTNRVVNNNQLTSSIKRSTMSAATAYADDFASSSNPSPYYSAQGLISGLTVMQQVDWNSTPNVYIRGVVDAPLYIVDGFARSIDYIDPSDIETITVLKDGVATAMYGTRGANGVYVITTKRGAYRTREFNVKYTYGIGLPTNMPTMADAATYATAVNEALYYDGVTTPRYSDTEIEYFRQGDQDAYPNVDWLGEGLADMSYNHQFDIDFRGGTDNMRYFTSVNYNNEYGLLNEQWENYTGEYNNQMRNFEMSARTNLDIDMTPSTLVRVNFFGMLRQEHDPTTANNLYDGLISVPSAAYPIITSSGYWGGSGMFQDNPIAEQVADGFYRRDVRLLQADMVIEQDLSSLAEGLSFDFGIALDNSVTYREGGTGDYIYEINYAGQDPTYGGEAVTTSIWNGYYESEYTSVMWEGSLKYGRQIGKHDFNVTGQFRQEAYQEGDITDGSQWMNINRHSALLVAGYNYDDRYMLDAVANYSATSVISVGNKYRMYPAVSAAWMISNEDFLKGSDAVNMLKLRASVGKSGLDGIDYYQLDQQYFESGGGYYFGSSGTSSWSQYPERAAINNMQIENSTKYNVGIDAYLFNGLEITAEAYYDQRRNILVDGSNSTSTVFGQEIGYDDIGAADYKGVEFSARWKKKVGDFSYYVGANLALQTSEVIENGESLTPYYSEKGYPVGQVFGYVADGYFSDATDIANSAEHTFSTVSPGDVKYVDQNGDDVINQYDIVALGNSSTIPGLYYGIQLGAEWKGLGFNAVFQGVGQYSRKLAVDQIYQPLRSDTNNISMWYLEDAIRWTEDTKDTANVPRLSTLDNSNNYQTSTQWLADGSYFKLRSLNVYYNLPQSWVKKMQMNNMQVYVRGNNLFSIDHIDMLNAEDFSLGYPDLISLYAGVCITF